MSFRHANVAAATFGVGQLVLRHVLFQRALFQGDRDSDESLKEFEVVWYKARGIHQEGGRFLLGVGVVADTVQSWRYHGRLGSDFGERPDRACTGVQRIMIDPRGDPPT